MQGSNQDLEPMLKLGMPTFWQPYQTQATGPQLSSSSGHESGPVANLPASSIAVMPYSIASQVLPEHASVGMQDPPLPFATQSHPHAIAAVSAMQQKPTQQPSAKSSHEQLPEQQQQQVHGQNTSAQGQQRQALHEAVPSPSAPSAPLQPPHNHASTALHSNAHTPPNTIMAAAPVVHVGQSGIGTLSAKPPVQMLPRVPLDAAQLASATASSAAAMPSDSDGDIPEIDSGSSESNTDES